jgi:hypothetical protein
MPGGHTPAITGGTPAITGGTPGHGGTPSGPSPRVLDQLNPQPVSPGLAPAAPPLGGTGGHSPGLIPQDDTGGIYVPPIDGSNTNPLYPQLPNPNTGSGGHGGGLIQDVPDTGSSTCDPDYGMC